MPGCPDRGGARARLTLLATTAAAVCLLATPAAAQAPNGSRSYEPAAFAGFAPRTAIDMLEQIPGFVIVDATTERGLGQASGNVLINGKRVSAKSSTAVAELGRIPIQNVVRIDIVDGASLDVPGLTGQVANVIVNASDVSGQFVWRPDFRAYYTTPNLGRFESSVSGALGPVEYTLALQNNAGRGAAGGITRIYGPDRTLTEVRDEVWRYEAERPRVSGRFVYDGPGTSAGTLSVSYEKQVSGYAEKGVSSGPEGVRRWRRLGNDEDTHRFELGGDYEFQLGPGRLKLIGLDRDEHEPFYSDLVDVYATGAPTTGDSFARARQETERVARAEYRWSNRLGDFQVSGEHAFNSLDQTARTFTRRPNDRYEETPLPNGSARVEEKRYEVMATYGRTLSPRLSFQMSAGGEYSSLGQVGAGDRVRTFWRPKGLATAAWKPSPGLDLNLRLERRVGQLDFFNFLASVDLGDNVRNAGNLDLVPPQSWIGELEATRSLGRLGVTRLKVYGQLIDDIVDIVPIGAMGESPGNIDKATVYGFAWNGTFELGTLGWAGAKLDLRGEYEASRVRDPLTARFRPISNNKLFFYSVVLRHDIPRTSWAWGLEASERFNTLNYRLTEVGRDWEGPVWASVYVENKDVLGLTMRAAVDNAALVRGHFKRTVYVARRGGPVSFYETRDRNIGPIFRFEVRGRF